MNAEMKDVPLVVRHRRGSYQPWTSPLRLPVNEFLIEWEVIGHLRLSPFTLEIRMAIDAHWGGESLSWTITKDSDQVFKLESAGRGMKRNKLLFGPTDDSEFLKSVEQSMEYSGNYHSQRFLQFIEASRWTFAKENVYNESVGPKLKEGSLVKAPGGYESYNRSRWSVLVTQMLTVGISIGVWLMTDEYYALYVGFAIISLLSVIHWTYYRLNAIDATCVIPCLFFPPVGPILVFVWTIFNFLFARGAEKWFVLRQGHVEFYEAWDSPKREPVGVLLLDRYTEVKRSSIFPKQFVIATPYRSLRLFASSKRERDDWVKAIDRCIQLEFNSNLEGTNEGGIASSFASMRSDIPVKHLVDAREAYEEIFHALSNAKREIYIAGWMLSPEIYLLRESHASGFTLPAQDGGLFQLRQPTKIVPGSRHLYQLPSDLEPVVLSSYDFMVVKATMQRPLNARWVVSGLCADSGQWVELSRVQNVNMRRFCDAMEPVRFKVSYSDSGGDGKTTGVVRCTAFDFSFFEMSSENGSTSETMPDAVDESWIDVSASSFYDKDQQQKVFWCGGIRLHYGEKDPPPLHHHEEQDDTEGEVPSNTITESMRSDSIMDRFFKLISRTEQESQLDRLYRIFTGRSTTPSNAGEAGQVEEPGASEYSSLGGGDVEAFISNTGSQQRDDSSDVSAPATFAMAANAPQSSSSAFFEAHLDDHDPGMFSKSFHSRLDRVIARKVVEEGVKCYILVYRDVDLFLPNASASAKRKFLASALWNRNIQVIRHAPEGRSYGSIQHFLTCSFSRGKTWWSHHEKMICVDQSVAFVGGLDMAFGRFDDGDHHLWDFSRRVWKGQDYYNPHFTDFDHLAHAPYLDSIRRSEIPRMPWHDVHCRVGGLAATDVAKHFIGRWNAEKRELKPGDNRFRVLLPRYPQTASTSAADRMSFQGEIGSKHGGPTTTLTGELNTSDQQTEGPQPSRSIHHRDDDDDTHISSCQVLRSVAPWSSPSNTERSILDAYLSLISTSKRFVYIEQQFFSSGLAGPPVRNPIAKTLADRVCRAIVSSGSSIPAFRVIIVLPVLLAFEGSLAENGSARSVLHWNLTTIQKMWEYIDRSLANDSERTMARRILGFYTLRQVEPNALRHHQYHTEQIYVHSKVLIVDDESAIIGSANLNDRSMLGTRDSEIAVLIKGGAAGPTNHQHHQRDGFARSLRRKLFAEHTGTSSKMSWGDPLTDEWDVIAERNTSIIERMFPDVPRDSFETLRDLSKIVPSSTSSTSPWNQQDPFEIKIQFATQLQGHLFRFPIRFLSKEKALLPRAVRGERESVLPLENFT